MYMTLGILKASTSLAAAYPTFVSRSHSEGNSGTSRTVTLPGSIVAGQRIVLVIGIASGSITVPPSGYTQVTLPSTQTVYHKLAAGSDASTSFTISSASIYSNHLALVFDGATQVAASSNAVASTANGNSPSLTVPWGASSNLFMSVIAMLAGGSTASAYPTNCPLYRFNDSVSDSLSDVYHAGAESLLATFDPDAFTTNANSHKAFTLGLAA
jgi:hypothetical protein